MIKIHCNRCNSTVDIGGTANDVKVLEIIGKLGWWKILTPDRYTFDRHIHLCEDCYKKFVKFIANV